jgi:hypothetical protein
LFFLLFFCGCFQSGHARYSNGSKEPRNFLGLLLVKYQCVILWCCWSQVKQESVSKFFLQKLPNFLTVTDLQTLFTIEFPCEIHIVSISYLSHGLDNWVFVIVNCVPFVARTGLCSWHQGNSALKSNIQGLILLKSPHFCSRKSWYPRWKHHPCRPQSCKDDEKPNT